MISRQFPTIYDKEQFLACSYIKYTKGICHSERCMQEMPKLIFKYSFKF